MAVLKPHFQLTPLIGAGNLVGVSAGEDTEHVVVTLGPNMVSNFHVYSQKAVKSWATSKPNKFTSPVIFTEQDGNYVGVINNKSLRKWDSDTASLDMVKNYGFTTAIHHLASLPDGRGFIQYSNGYSELLEVGIESRKEEKPEILAGPAGIGQSRVINFDGSWVNVILTECKKDDVPKLMVYCVRLSPDFRPESHIVFSIKNKKGVKPLGAAITDQVEIIVYWSDGQLVIQNALCSGGDKKIVDSYHLNRLSEKQPVAIAILDKRHILIYGADVSDEGGLLILWDTKFGIVDASRKLKSFCYPPVVFSLRKSSQVLLPVGENLIVLPYEVKATKLAAVFAKHLGDACSSDVCASLSWGSSEEESAKNGENFEIGIADAETRKLYDSLERSGTSSHLILEQALPRVIADDDLTGIISLLELYKSLPERLLVDSLKIAAQKMAAGEDRPAALNLMEKLMNIPFTDTQILKPLRKMKLGDVATVIEFIFSVLKGDVESNLDSEKAVDWMCVLFDAHFTQLAICQDERIQRTLNDVKIYVDAEVGALECLTKVETIVETLKTMRPKQEQPRNHFYAIEVVQLY